MASGVHQQPDYQWKRQHSDYREYDNFQCLKMNGKVKPIKIQSKSIYRQFSPRPAGPKNMTIHLMRRF
jgi:hypothetical protein